MRAAGADSAVQPSILIVDGDIDSRHFIADDLRPSGYRIVEATKANEALIALGEQILSIDVVLCDGSAVGSADGLELASWVRTKRPELHVRVAGRLKMTAESAAELRESGPHCARSYDPAAVVDSIQRLRASHCK